MNRGTENDIELQYIRDDVIDDAARNVSGLIPSFELFVNQISKDNGNNTNTNVLDDNSIHLIGRDVDVDEIAHAFAAKQSSPSININENNQNQTSPMMDQHLEQQQLRLFSNLYILFEGTSPESTSQDLLLWSTFILSRICKTLKRSKIGMNDVSDIIKQATILFYKNGYGFTNSDVKILWAATSIINDESNHQDTSKMVFEIFHYILNFSLSIHTMAWSSKSRTNSLQRSTNLQFISAVGKFYEAIINYMNRYSHFYQKFALAPEIFIKIIEFIDSQKELIIHDQSVPLTASAIKAKRNVVDDNVYVYETITKIVNLTLSSTSTAKDRSNRITAAALQFVKSIAHFLFLRQSPLNESETALLDTFAKCICSILVSTIRSRAFSTQTFSECVEIFGILIQISTRIQSTEHLEVFSDEHSAIHEMILCLNMMIDEENFDKFQAVLTSEPWIELMNYSLMVMDDEDKWAKILGSNNTNGNKSFTQDSSLDKFFNKEKISSLNSKLFRGLKRERDIYLPVRGLRVALSTIKGLSWFVDYFLSISQNLEEYSSDIECHKMMEGVLHFVKLCSSAIFETSKGSPNDDSILASARGEMILEIQRLSNRVLMVILSLLSSFPDDNMGLSSNDIKQNGKTNDGVTTRADLISCFSSTLISISENIIDILGITNFSPRAAVMQAADDEGLRILLAIIALSFGNAKEKLSNAALESLIILLSSKLNVLADDLIQHIAEVWHIIYIGGNVFREPPSLSDLYSISSVIITPVTENMSAKYISAMSGQSERNYHILLRDKFDIKTVAENIASSKEKYEQNLRKSILLPFGSNISVTKKGTPSKDKADTSPISEIVLQNLSTLEQLVKGYSGMSKSKDNELQLTSPDENLRLLGNLIESFLKIRHERSLLLALIYMKMMYEYFNVPGPGERYWEFGNIALMQINCYLSLEKQKDYDSIAKLLEQATFCFKMSGATSEYTRTLSIAKSVNLSDLDSSNSRWQWLQTIQQIPIIEPEIIAVHYFLVGYQPPYAGQNRTLSGIFSDQRVFVVRYISNLQSLSSAMEALATYINNLTGLLCMRDVQSILNYNVEEVNINSVHLLWRTNQGSNINQQMLGCFPDLVPAINVYSAGAFWVKRVWPATLGSSEESETKTKHCPKSFILSELGAINISAEHTGTCRVYFKSVIGQELNPFCSFTQVKPFALLEGDESVGELVANIPHWAHEAEVYDLRFAEFDDQIFNQQDQNGDEDLFIPPPPGHPPPHGDEFQELDENDGFNDQAENGFIPLPPSHPPPRQVETSESQQNNSASSRDRLPSTNSSRGIAAPEKLADPAEEATSPPIDDFEARKKKKLAEIQARNRADNKDTTVSSSLPSPTEILQPSLELKNSSSNNNDNSNSNTVASSEPVLIMPYDYNASGGKPRRNSQISEEEKVNGSQIERNDRSESINKNDVIVLGDTQGISQDQATLSKDEPSARSSSLGKAGRHRRRSSVESLEHPSIDSPDLVNKQSTQTGEAEESRNRRSSSVASTNKVDAPLLREKQETDTTRTRGESTSSNRQTRARTSSKASYVEPSQSDIALDAKNGEAEQLGSSNRRSSLGSDKPRSVRTASFGSQAAKEKQSEELQHSPQFDAIDADRKDQSEAWDTDVSVVKESSKDQIDFANAAKWLDNIDPNMSEESGHIPPPPPAVVTAAASDEQAPSNTSQVLEPPNESEEIEEPPTDDEGRHEFDDKEDGEEEEKDDYVKTPDTNEMVSESQMQPDLNISNEESKDRENDEVEEPIEEPPSNIENDDADSVSPPPSPTPKTIDESGHINEPASVLKEGNKDLSQPKEELASDKDEKNQTISEDLDQPKVESQDQSEEQQQQKEKEPEREEVKEKTELNAQEVPSNNDNVAAQSVESQAAQTTSSQTQQKKSGKSNPILLTKVGSFQEPTTTQPKGTRRTQSLQEILDAKLTAEAKSIKAASKSEKFDLKGAAGAQQQPSIHESEPHFNLFGVRVSAEEAALVNKFLISREAYLGAELLDNNSSRFITVKLGHGKAEIYLDPENRLLHQFALSKELEVSPTQASAKVMQLNAPERSRVGLEPLFIRCPRPQLMLCAFAAFIDQHNQQ